MTESKKHILASLHNRSKISLMKLFMMLIALLLIPVSECTCFSTLKIYKDHERTAFFPRPFLVPLALGVLFFATFPPARLPPVFAPDFAGIVEDWGERKETCPYNATYTDRVSINTPLTYTRCRALAKRIELSSGDILHFFQAFGAGHDCECAQNRTKHRFVVLKNTGYSSCPSSLILPSGLGRLRQPSLSPSLQASSASSLSYRLSCSASSRLSSAWA